MQALFLFFVLTSFACTSTSTPTNSQGIREKQSNQQWIETQYPELRTLRTSVPLDLAKKWGDLKNSSVFTRSCKPLRTDRRGNDIYAKLPSGDGCHSELLLGSNLLELGSNCPANKGGFGSSSTGDLQTIIPYSQSKISEQAIWYSGLRYRLEVACDEFLETVATCPNAQKRCKQCSHWGLHRRSLSVGGFGKHVTMKTTTLPKSEGCNQTCPTMPYPQDVTRANKVLRDQIFRSHDDTAPPLFFRTKTACQEFRKTYTFSQEQLDVVNFDKNDLQRVSR